MGGPTRTHWATATLPLLGVLAAVAIGVELRLRDPLSGPVLAAEDPYNHMALVREHVRDGTLDPLNTGSRLYPPGMHAYVAAVWAYTGLDLHELMRFGPVLLGALSIVGIAFLLWRFDGALAACVGAFGVAVAPEAITRTTMMAPTALDLALAPFFLYAVLEVVRGRLAWTAPMALLALFLVFAHPWFLTILALAGVAFTLLASVLPWPATRGPPPSARGLAAAAAVVGLSWALSVSGCGGWCGPGFDDVYPGGQRVGPLAPLIAGFAVLAAFVLVAGSRRVDGLFARAVPSATATGPRVAASLALAAFVGLGTVHAIRKGLPPLVDLDAMFGWPLLVLGAIAFVAVPFVAGPAAHMGAAVIAVTYPFVIYDPFDSPFWSHRTAAYLGIGLVLVLGVGAAAAARAAPHAARALQRTTRRGPSARTRATLVVALPLFVTAAIAGTVYASTPEPPHWYRLYDACEFGALGAIGANASATPAAILVTGDWQAKLVLAALTPDATRVWFKSDFFTSPKERDAMLHQGRPVWVVVDKHLRAETPGADTGFLQGPPWQPLGRWCGPNATGAPSLLAYAAPGTRR